MVKQESFSVDVTEEQGFFPEEWATRVQQILYRKAEESTVRDIKQLYRVPKALLSGNAQAYVPRLISLGPYHHHHFKHEEQDEVMNMSIQDAYKVKSAATLSQGIAKYDQSLDAIFGMIVEKLPEIGSFYQWQMTGSDQYANNCALMMMVDTFFLMYFMYSLFDRPDYVEKGDDVKCDILKLENQVPLSVVKEVYEKVKGVLFPGGFDDYHYLLRRTCLELSPFYFFWKRGTEKSEPHLLSFIHTNVSPHLEFQFAAYSHPTLWQRMSRFVNHYVIEKMCSIFFCFTCLTSRVKQSGEQEPAKGGIEYTAVELTKAGIKFKPGYNNVRLDKYSRTLYIPRMNVSSVQTTEVFFRNLFALEFLYAARPRSVTQFIQLMDCLIGTLEDVHVLKKCKVITFPNTLRNEDIAKMWDSICQSSRGPKESSIGQLIKELKEELGKERYQTKVRIKIHAVKTFILKSCHEYHQQYLSKPWNVVALLVGTIILAMNIVHAYCSLRGCKS